MNNNDLYHSIVNNDDSNDNGNHDTNDSSEPWKWTYCWKAFVEQNTYNSILDDNDNN